MSHKSFAVTETLKLIEAGNAEGYRNYLHRCGVILPPRKFKRVEEFNSYVKSFDLGIILGLESNFCCIFHDDKSPSASIYQAPSGDWLYRCRATGCPHGNRGMNIIKIVEVLLGKTTQETYAFLKAAFNADIEEKNQSHSKNMFDENIDILVEKFQTLAPVAFKVTELGVLVALYDFGRTLNKIDCINRDSVTFSMSNNQIREGLGDNNVKISPYLAQLEYLGFIHRLRLYELDSRRYESMSRYLDVKKQNSKGRGLPTNQIQVFCLTEERLVQIEKNALSWRKMGYSISTFTYYNVYAKEGSFVAHKVLPYGVRVYEKNKNPYVEIKNDVLVVLRRQLAEKSELPLNELKRILIQRGCIPSQIPRYLKSILDEICSEDYYRAKIGRFTVIRKRETEEQQAA